MSLYDDNEEIYELVIKKEELGLFNRVEDYRTKDLFKNITWNPRVVGEYHSRCDDILVHITGEKTNPIPMEDLLNQCSVVARSVILGKNHTLNHCMIQLDWSKVGLIDFETAMELVREQVKLVNDASPSHSRLLQDCIHILGRDQEIMVTVKGNVIRQVNYNLYKHLVEDTKILDLPTPTEPDSAFLNITKIISEALNLPEKIDPDENFFKIGMDSLSALIVVKKLQHSFSNFVFNVSQIYKLKTVNNIMDYMDQNFVIEEFTVHNIQHKIDSMIDRYISKFADYTNAECNRRAGKRSVLVVGSNGSLACHYILALLHREDVDRVIGLIRGGQFEDKTDYQVFIMKQKGLFIHQRVLHKLQCFSADMHLSNFNLPESVYRDIFDNVTEVTQVGWRMNFLNSLEDFEDCIETTSNLLEFCLQNPKNPKIFNFISTIAPTVPTYKIEYNGIIPETPTSVSEQICYQVAKTKNLPVNVFRVGELSGDQSFGQWNMKEFLPLLIRAIVKLKVYPNLSSKSISWVPIDLAAKSLADLGHFKTQNPELYTIVNPQKSEWKPTKEIQLTYALDYGN
ncbi:hypothetical protein CONCODRAFT_3325 [Conidiobolus coronatus NRRL 28638]|uniref:Carrier domain-containing protein n=1 Tax=Conidiobolus coronatus (strain ATCC 28846 / CBS 209.66 / NRRL 28638) TaxID=796925 RepID=A0A137PF65_CONC2|nr:hypothetical protein CONCODRAFT_3325 [Conidiobolus coronatus NRRL 28638]|eukprot:KXN73644.1 hypothetical protein CONCODRAFT_3325 [Conidiobolus coronatus NRRL 28638]